MDSKELWIQVAIGSENPEEAVRRIAHPSGGVEHGGYRSCHHHAHMFQHMCAWCRHTRGRFERTHGGVFEAKYGFFPRFVQRAATHTNTHTKHTTTTKQHHDHNDTHHTTPQHTIPHGDRERQRQTEAERDRERETRQEKRRRDKKREDETRKEKKREDERGETRKDKRRDKMKKKREDERENEER